MNYDNFETLKNYAINYYLRYYPSKNRLKEKLLKKSSEDNCIEVINTMSSIIDDRTHCKSKNRKLYKKREKSKLYKIKTYRKKVFKRRYRKYLRKWFS